MKIRKALTIKTESKEFGYWMLNDNMYYLPFYYAWKLYPSWIPHEHQQVDLGWKGQAREYQIPLFESALQTLKQQHCHLLGLYTGFGKTITAAYLASQLGYCTLILIQAKVLVKSWRDCFKTVTNASIWVVDDKKPPTAYNVIICMVGQVHKIPNDILSGVGTLIIDEAHRFCVPSMVQAVLSVQPRYLILETASLTRSDGAQTIMHALTGPHRVEITIDKRFRVIFTHTPYKVEKKTRLYKGQEVTDWNALVNDYAEIHERNQQIVQFASLLAKTVKVLIMTARIEHTQLLHRMLVESGTDADWCAGTKKKTVRDARVIVGTMQKIGIGWDQAAICTDFDGEPFKAMLLVASTKEAEALKQYVGRVLRVHDVDIYHFVDNNSIIKAHVYENKKWYRTCDATLLKANLDDLIEALETN